MSAMGAPSPESEQRFRTLFEQAPFSVQLLAADGHTLQVNQSWRDLWGIQEGDPLFAWILAEYNVLSDAQLEAKGVTPLLRRAFAGEAVRIPATYYDPSEQGRPGRARWVEATASPIKDADGRVLEVMLIHQDVTDRVLADSQLRASEVRWKQLANTIPQLAWIADAQGHVEWYNERWFEYTGTTLEEMRGWGWQSVPDPQALPAVMEAWRRSLATGEPFRMTFPLRGRDGSYRPFFTLVAPLRDEAGRVVNWFGTNTDVSPLHEAEQARREGERRKDEFLAMLAHELRNPLAPISTAAQLLKLPGADAARAERVGEIVERQVRHMTKLVDDLLDVSRVTRGLVTLRIESLPLDELVGNAVEQVTPLLQTSGHTLEVHEGLQGLAVQGDRIRVVQILVNLLSNAAKYSPAGSRIEVLAQHEGGRVRISVRDNGIGIDAAFLPHIFDLFTQAGRTLDRSQGGLGIGLALVKSLVEMHGGEVTAVSAGAGRGSCFSFTLPVAGAAPREVGAPAGTEDDPQEDTPASRIRVLVVDDNVDAAETLATVLGWTDCEVRTAHDASQALKLAPGFQADLYILDIGLPNMDGYELVRRLREDVSLAPATYVALTGYGQVRDRELSRTAGFDLHLVKPVAPDALRKLVRDVSRAAGASRR